MIPRYTHDCERCRYLGRCDYPDPWSGAWIAADLYFCQDTSVPRTGTCIARIGHEPDQYASAPLYIAEQYKPPFSTTGRALYVAAIGIISERRANATKDTP
jgi:hypothetical protein